MPARPRVTSERDGLADLGRRHEPPGDPHRDDERDVALLLPEDAAVVPFVDLDVVVEKSHGRQHENADPCDHCLVGEDQSVTEVGNHPPEEGRDHDGDPAHGRRALLVHVVVGPAIFLAEDRLTLASVAEERDQVSGADQRKQHRHGPGDHHGDHWTARRISKATTRSSKGSTWSPMVCVGSCPFPAINTTSPELAWRMAISMALWLSGSITTRPL